MFPRRGALAWPPGLAGPVPRRRRWPFVLLAASVAAAALALWPTARGPATLADARLVGPRAASCVQVTLVIDTSGSMRDFAPARDAALAQALGWLPHNLRPDDEVAVVDMAAAAQVRLAAVPMTAVPTAVPPPTGVRDGHDTLLGPPLDAVGAMSTSCERAVVLFSDDQLADLPRDEGAGRALLQRHGVRTVQSLVPGADVVVPGQWSVAFPDAAPIRFDGTDGVDTALAIGRAVAAVTGQRLEKG